MEMKQLINYQEKAPHIHSQYPTLHCIYLEINFAMGVVRDWKKRIGSLYTDKGRLRAFLKTLRGEGGGGQLSSPSRNS
jgi:hypothetical protein